MPSALSTSRMPSGSALKDVTNFLQNLFFDFGEAPANARAGSQCMSAAAEFAADAAVDHLFFFSTHAHAHSIIGVLLKEDGDHDAAYSSEIVHHIVVVFTKN